MRKVAVLGVLLVVTGSVHVGAGAKPASAACADVTVPLRMFKIEAKWAKPSYKVGDTAKLKVNVTRTDERDPVTDEGMPWPTGRPIEEPAEGVGLGLALFVGDVYLNAGGITDAAGNAIIPVKIKAYADPGTGVGRLYGEKILINDFPDSSCRILIKEYGVLEPIPKVRITG